MMLPFPGGIDATANGTLIFSAGAALLYLVTPSAGPSWRNTVIKTAGVGLLAFLAFDQSAPWLLVLALALGATGDAALSLPGEKAFLSGLAAFLLSHIAYVALFIAEGASLAALLADWWRPVVAIGIIAGGIFMWRTLSPHLPPTMRVPVAAYALVIITMGIAAAATPGVAVLCGAALFIASDAILSLERFVLSPASPWRRWTGPVLWLLYYGAQATLALAFIL
jgi:uncharacterized membrane protein YhhN